jgi:hypothetical protein
MKKTLLSLLTTVTFTAPTFASDKLSLVEKNLVTISAAHTEIRKIESALAMSRSDSPLAYASTLPLIQGYSKLSNLIKTELVEHASTATDPISVRIFIEMIINSLGTPPSPQSPPDYIVHGLLNPLLYALINNLPHTAAALSKADAPEPPAINYKASVENKIASVKISSLSYAARKLKFEYFQSILELLQKTDVKITHARVDGTPLLYNALQTASQT